LEEPLFFRVSEILAAIHDRHIRLDERLPGGADEIEHRLGRVHVVEEDAADAAGLVAVLRKKYSSHSRFILA